MLFSEWNHSALRGLCQLQRIPVTDLLRQLSIECNVLKTEINFSKGKLLHYTFKNLKSKFSAFFMHMDIASISSSLYTQPMSHSVTERF